MSRRQPSFIGIFNHHVKKGEWVTGRELAEREGATDSDTVRDRCQRLSNLERYGHVLRRFNPKKAAFEYAQKGTSEVRKTSWFPSDPNS